MPINFDPNAFHVDWNRTFEALMLIILLAFVVERALAMLFESRFWIERWDKPGLKELIATAVSIAVCWYWKFDALSMFILTTDHVQVAGFFLTGAVIAGGSKASIKLFHDVLGAKSSTYDQRHEIRAQNAAEDAEQAVEKLSPNATKEATAKVEKQVTRAARDAVQAASASGTTLSADAAQRAMAAQEEVTKLARAKGVKP